jgi:hypothetical protein
LKKDDVLCLLPASAVISKEQNQKMKQASVYFLQSYHPLKREKPIFKTLTVAKS